MAHRNKCGQQCPVEAVEKSVAKRETEKERIERFINSRRPPISRKYNKPIHF